MDKKTVTSILAILLLVAFFLPYLSFGGLNLSGFNLVFGKGGLLAGKGNMLWITLLVPLGAILVLAGSFGLDNSLKSGFVFWMPLIGIIYLGVRMFLAINTAARGGLDMGEFLSVMGYGFWITLAVSIGLLVNNSRKELATA